MSFTHAVIRVYRVQTRLQRRIGYTVGQKNNNCQFWRNFMKIILKESHLTNIRPTYLQVGLTYLSRYYTCSYGSR